MRRPERRDGTSGDLIGAHPDAGVGDFGFETQATVAHRPAADPQNDLAGLGELGGVAQEIRQDLRQPKRIADQPARHRGIAGDDELEVPSRASWAQ